MTRVRRNKGPRDGRPCIGCPCCRTPLDMGSDYCERCHDDEHSDRDPHDTGVILHAFTDRDTSETYDCGQSYGNAAGNDDDVNCPACLAMRPEFPTTPTPPEAR